MAAGSGRSASLLYVRSKALNRSKRKVPNASKTKINRLVLHQAVFTKHKFSHIKNVIKNFRKQQR